MQIVPTEKAPNPDTEEGDWEWTERFEQAFGNSSICEINGHWLQLLNPVVLPSTRLGKEGTSTYHFRSAELIVIAATLYNDFHAKLSHLQEVSSSPTFPYQTVGGAYYYCSDNFIGTHIFEKASLVSFAEMKVTPAVDMNSVAACAV
jgi:hypothetical protein